MPCERAMTSLTRACASHAQDDGLLIMLILSACAGHHGADSEER